MIELRDYQKPVVADAVRILKDLHIVYLMCEMRVGKTFMSFTISREAGYKDEEVLFLTRRAAIQRITYARYRHRLTGSDSSVPSVITKAFTR